MKEKKSEKEVKKIKKDKKDERGVTAIVAVVLLIAIAVIAAVSIYFWMAGLTTKQPTPQTPVPIIANPIGNGKVLIANLGQKTINTSTLRGSDPNLDIKCEKETIAPGEQVLCKITGTPSSKTIAIYGEGTGSSIIHVTNETSGGSSGGGTTDNPPRIVNVNSNTTSGNVGDYVRINATITDDSGVVSVLLYTNTTGVWGSYPMSLTSGNSTDGNYSATIQLQHSGTISYYVWANDTGGNEVNSDQYSINVSSGSVTNSEPVFVSIAPEGNYGAFLYSIPSLGKQYEYVVGESQGGKIVVLFRFGENGEVLGYANATAPDVTQTGLFDSDADYVTSQVFTTGYAKVGTTQYPFTVSFDGIEPSINWKSLLTNATRGETLEQVGDTIYVGTQTEILKYSKNGSLLLQTPWPQTILEMESDDAGNLVLITSDDHLIKLQPTDTGYNEIYNVTIPGPQSVHGGELIIPGSSGAFPEPNVVYGIVEQRDVSGTDYVTVFKFNETSQTFIWNETFSGKELPVTDNPTNGKRNAFLASALYLVYWDKESSTADVTKLDKTNGNQIWTWNTTNFAFSICGDIETESTYLVGLTFTYDYAVVSLDSNGNERWNSTIDLGDLDAAISCEVGSNGILYTTGVLDSKLALVGYRL